MRKVFGVQINLKCKPNLNQIYVKELIIYSNRFSKIDKNFELILDFSKPGTKLFVEEAKEYKLPKIKKLRLDWLDKLRSIEIIDVNMFLKHASPPSLSSLYMYGGEFMLLDSFKEGLETVLQGVTDQVYLFHFLLRESGLRTIIEYSSNAEELVLRG